MHDDSVATLEEAIDHYAAGGRTLTEGPYQGVGAHDDVVSTRRRQDAEDSFRRFTLRLCDFALGYK
jgi:hypothetical protein